MALADLQSQRSQILAEIQRRGGAAKAPGFAKQLTDIEGQIRTARANPAEQAAGTPPPETGGGLTNDTGVSGPQEPATPPAADQGALEKRRAELEMEMKRSAQGSDRQKAFADKLASARTDIQNAKTAAGQPLTRPTGVTGAQMVQTLNQRSGNKAPTPPPQAQADPAAPPAQGVVGDNFKLGDTDARLQQQFERANSEIARRGGTAPNNQARLAAIQAEQNRRKGAGTPPATGGGLQGPQPDPNAQTGQPPQVTPGVQNPGQNPGQQPGGNNPGQNSGPGNGYGGYGGYGGSGPTDNPYGANPNLPGMFSRGAGGFQAPQLPAYQYQQSYFGQQQNPYAGQPQQENNSPGAQSIQGNQVASEGGMMQAQGAPSQMQGGPQTPQSMIGGIYDQATGGTINQFNTAANRLRERLDASRDAALDQNKTRNIGRGFGNSGAVDEGAFQINQGSQDAYANGLNQLSNQFESQRQQGLQTGLGAANSAQQGMENFNALKQKDLADLRGLNNSNYQFQSGQDTQNRQFMDSNLFGLQNNRESRGSAERISNNDINSRMALQQGQQGFQGSQADLDRQFQQMMAEKGYAFQGGQNSDQRALQQALAQMQQNGDSYRTSLQQLMSQYGQGAGGFGGGSLGGSGVSLGGSVGGSTGFSRNPGVSSSLPAEPAGGYQIFGRR